ncbi:SemiSWEET family sugar transporter [Pinisolibacter aquiterrae]|uniref:SemiSWEET family sugar transporter n=1 Tax=Pinisolibacter aquiterrae TaxID=2815579 RepID=UPI001E3BB480|nr:SemiSWEET transporter [Pinisolibacter aquiterrae]
MFLSPLQIELLGGLAALMTTLCWLPQTIRAIRHRDVASLSLFTFVIFSGGIFLWLVYGILIGSWPVILANMFSLVLNLAIVFQKIRHG